MSALDGWIDVCRAGTWRDMAGRDVAIDEARLDRIVDAHAVADPAPVVVGHPETDAPAFAWIDGLRRVGDRLQAKLRDIAPALPRGGRGRALRRPLDRAARRHATPCRVPGRPRTGGVGAGADPLRVRARDGGRVY